MPTQHMKYPFAPRYDPNVKCDFLSVVVGHSIEDSIVLKEKVQELFDSRQVTFNENALNENNNRMT